MSKLIAIVGATGSQGGSVLRSLAADPAYKVRALTRTPDSDAAKKLKQEFPDIEIVQADLNDEASLDAALAGAYGCFAVTFTPHAILPPEKWREYETAQGKRLGDVCKKHQIAHVVFSTVDPAYRAGTKPLPELDAKAETLTYMREQGLAVTGIMMAYYFENMMSVFKPKKLGPHEWGFMIPMEGSAQAQTSVTDIGPIVKHHFENKAEYEGKVTSVTSELLKVPQIVDTLNKHLAPIKFKDLGMTLDDFRKTPNPLAGEIAKLLEATRLGEKEAAMFQQCADFCHKVHPKMLTFDQWVQKEKEVLMKIFSE